MVNLVFIVGCARSGTSILGELIASHPDVNYIFEERGIWEKDILGENDGHRLQAYQAITPINKKIWEWFEVISKNKIMVVEKNPRHTLRIPFIRAIFPEAKFIHIIRDGRDVACSMVPGCGGVEWRHLKPPSWKEFYDKYTGAMRCAHVWKEVIEIALDDLNNIPHLQVNYETLVSSPFEVSQKIFDFLGLDLHSNTKEFCKVIANNTHSSYHAKFQKMWYQDNHQTRIGRWQENLSPEEKESINILLGPQLVQLGYINR